MIYVVSQIIGFIGFIVSLIAYHRKKKETILKNMLIANVLDLTHYFLLGAYSGCITKVIAILRNAFIIIKGKFKILSSKIFLIIFIVMYVVAGVLLYNGVLSMFPIVAAIIYMVGIWNGDEVTVKKIACLCYFLWLAYNIYVLSISGIVSNIVSIISTYIAIKYVIKEQ